MVLSPSPVSLCWRRAALAQAVRMWSRTELVLVLLASLLLVLKGVVYGSLISTQNNETSSKQADDNEQFNRMLGHKKRHEANRQHPSNLLLGAARCVDPALQSDQDCGLLVNEVIEALDKLMDFFNKNLDQLIADGFVGIAIAQGQLKQLATQLPASPQPYLTPLVDGLVLKASQILDRFDPELHGVPEIGQGMKVLLQQEMWITSSKIHPAAAIAFGGDEAPLEDDDDPTYLSSDHCLGQLLSRPSPCRISADCWDMQKIAPSEKFSYGTTHHLFYFHIAKKLRCKVEGRDLDALIASACDKILQETRAIAESNFPESRRDLFLEQIALCGLQDELGTSFVRPEWIQEALKWQKPATGCYGVNSDRVKRNEKLIPSGCLVHFSSVAAAALATSLRVTLLL